MITTPEGMLSPEAYFAVVKHSRGWYYVARVVRLETGNLYQVGPWETPCGLVSRKEAMGRAREAANRTGGAILSGKYVEPPSPFVSGTIIPEREARAYKSEDVEA